MSLYRLARRLCCTYSVPYPVLPCFATCSAPDLYDTTKKILGGPPTGSECGLNRFKTKQVLFEPVHVHVMATDLVS